MLQELNYNNNNEEEENEENEENEDDEEKEKENEDLPILHKQYIFSCIGIGLKNVARIELQ